MMSLTAGFLSTAVCNNLKLKSQVPIRHNSYQFDAPKARGSDIKRVKGYEYEKGQYLLIEQHEIRSRHRRLGGPWRLANSCLSPRSILFILILLLGSSRRVRCKSVSIARGDPCIVPRRLPIREKTDKSQALRVATGARNNPSRHDCEVRRDRVQHSTRRRSSNLLARPC